jgi:hypothetical protein
LSDTALAAFILLVLIHRREGIMRGREFRWPVRRRAAPPPAQVVPETGSPVKTSTGAGVRNSVS